MCFFLALAFFVSAAYAVERGLSRKVETPYLKGTYRALVIGNQNYVDPTGMWKPLKTAVNDAKSFADVLRTEFGFSDVDVILNGTQREILLALNNLSQRAQVNDSVVVYYAGHGYLEEDSGRGYWIPVDAKGQDHTTYIRNSTIRDELDLLGQRVKHTLLVSDSCFSGALLRGGNRSAAVKENGERYYQKVAQKKSVQILAAGGVEFVDDDYRSSGHSPFTYFLINELKNHDAPLLTATELALNVEKAVANNVKQTPESGVLQGSGDELGEFLFTKLSIKIEITAEPAKGGTQGPVPIVVETPTIVIKQPAPSREDMSDALLMLPML